MRKQKIALVALHFAEYAVNLAEALAARSDVLLVVYRDNAANELGADWSERFANNNVSLLTLDQPRSLASMVISTLKMTLALKKFRPDVIHYQEGLRDEILLSLPFFFFVPKVLTVHDPLSHSGTDATRIKYSRYRLYRSLIRRTADMALTHGQHLADQLVTVCPHLNGRVVKVAHGPLGISGGSYSTPKPKDLRLLFFGRIHEYKGLCYFVEAVIRLRKEGFPVIGVVAGRGGDLERYRRQMVDAGCFEILDRYVPSAEVSRLFIDAKVVVLPYTDGTQSGVAAMALGYGRPVVASRVGSIPELVRHQENGLLVPPKEIDSLVDAVRLVITNELLWDELSSGARQLRDGELSWETIASKTSNVYDQLMS